MKDNLRFTVFLICGYCAIALAQNPVMISRGTNLIVNGDFEQGTNFSTGWQVDLWTGSHYNPGEFKAVWDKQEFHTGKKSINLHGSGIQDVGREICRIGLRSSPIRLEPDTEYRLHFWYKTSKAIKLQQKYQPVWVVLLGPQTDWGRWNDRRFPTTDGEWMEGDLPLHSLANTPQEARIEFRNCGDGDVWFDNVSLVNEGKNETLTIKGKKWTILPHMEDHPQTALTAKDREKGFVLFTRDDPTGIYPNSFPAEGESTAILRTFAVSGEYEPVQFAVYPLRDLKQVTVRVSNLKNEKGDSIKSETVDIRTVKCWLQVDRNVGGDDKIQVVPELLEEIRPLDLKAKMPQQYWLTIHVPDNAPAGKYVGEIEIQEQGGSSRQIELGLRVLPFKLIDEVPYPIGWYADISAMSPGNKVTRYSWTEVAQRFKDMKEHGMTCMVWCYPDCAFTLDDFRRLSVGKKLQLDFSSDNKVIEYYKAAGLKGPVVLDLTRLSGLVAAFLKLNYPASYYRDGNFGSSFYILESEASAEFVAIFKEAIRQIDQNAKKNHWPPLYYYVVDEPGYQGERALMSARIQQKWIKEAVTTAKTYCTIYEADLANKYLVPYLDVRTSGLTGEKDKKDNEEQTRKYGVEQWGIGGPEDMEKIAYNYGRLGVGFALKKAGQTGMTFWRYGNTMEFGTNYSAKNGDWDPYADMRDPSPGGKDFAISYRSPRDGSPVPTLGWEGLREGVDDLRYMLTLEQYIDKCEKSSDGKIKAAGAQARKALNEILANIPWKIKTKDWWSDKGVSNGEMTKYRWIIAMEILKLKKAMETSRECPMDSFNHASTLDEKARAVDDLVWNHCRSPENLIYCFVMGDSLRRISQDDIARGAPDPAKLNEKNLRYGDEKLQVRIVNQKPQYLLQGIPLEDVEAYEDSVGATGVYLSALCFQYQATLDLAVLARAHKVFDAMYSVYELGCQEQPGWIPKPYGFRCTQQSSMDNQCPFYEALIRYFKIADASDRKRIVRVLTDQMDYWIRNRYKMHVSYFGYMVDYASDKDYPGHWALFFLPLCDAVGKITGETKYKEEWYRLLDRTRIEGDADPDYLLKKVGCLWRWYYAYGALLEQGAPLRAKWIEGMKDQMLAFEKSQADFRWNWNGRCDMRHYRFIWISPSREEDRKEIQQDLMNVKYKDLFYIWPEGYPFQDEPALSFRTNALSVGKSVHWLEIFWKGRTLGHW